MRLIAVGRLRAGPEADLFARYTARLRPKLTITEIADGAGTDCKRRENEVIRAALPANGFAVALDLAGEALSSTAFATRLQAWAGQQGPLCFVIGGAEGLDAATLTRADARLSLSTLTWPHMLVRVLLVEQIYRAQSIAAGHPYHRAGRP